MKKNTFLFAFVLCLATLQAQTINEFAPVGSSWVHCYQSKPIWAPIDSIQTLSLEAPSFQGLARKVGFD